jgi:hypothetical protein
VKRCDPIGLDVALLIHIHWRRVVHCVGDGFWKISRSHVALVQAWGCRWWLRIGLVLERGGGLTHHGELAE